MKRTILIIVSVIAGLILVAGAVLIVGMRFLWGRGLIGSWRGAIPMMAQGGRQPFNQGNQGRSPNNRLGPYNQPGQMSGGNNSFGPGMGMHNRGGMGMMQPSPFQPNSQTGDRISLDQALSKAQASLSSYGTNLKIGEIMEFGNNFYVSVKETDSSRGAFELLVDPYSGNVSPEPGPNMMWNSKYGHMMPGGQTSQTEMSVDQASQKARDTLKRVLPTAELQPDGTAFYGYVTFDYKVNGLTAGMLSVNSYTGGVWMHDWHGVFISEKQVP